MTNGFFWAAYISGAALISGYLMATPAILLLHRRSAPNVFWMYAVLPLTIVAWWCAYWLGLGPQSSFNAQELFILAAVYVLAVYALLMFQRRFERHAAPTRGFSSSLFWCGLTSSPTDSRYWRVNPFIGCLESVSLARSHQSFFFRLRRPSLQLAYYCRRDVFAVGQHRR
jgi:hypothetical protein